MITIIFFFKYSVCDEKVKSNKKKLQFAFKPKKSYNKKQTEINHKCY